MPFKLFLAFLTSIAFLSCRKTIVLTPEQIEERTTAQIITECFGKIRTPKSHTESQMLQTEDAQRVRECLDREYPNHPSLKTQLSTALFQEASLLSVNKRMDEARIAAQRALTLLDDPDCTTETCRSYIRGLATSMAIGGYGKDAISLLEPVYIQSRGQRGELLLTDYIFSITMAMVYALGGAHDKAVSTGIEAVGNVSPDFLAETAGSYSLTLFTISALKAHKTAEARQFFTLLQSSYDASLKSSSEETTKAFQTLKSELLKAGWSREANIVNTFLTSSKPGIAEEQNFQRLKQTYLDSIEERQAYFNQKPWDGDLRQSLIDTINSWAEFTTYYNHPKEAKLAYEEVERLKNNSFRSEYIP